MKSIIRNLRKQAIGIDNIQDVAPLIDHIGHSKIVMLGESSHGTHDFYKWRRILTEEVIAKYGFKFIAVEGDWPPCWALNRFIRSKTTESIYQTLSRFNRWPTWMWANDDIIELATRLKAHNAKLDQSEHVEFFGLDIYSLFESADAVLRQLNTINPSLARLIEERYSCFESYEHDEKAYARSLIQFPEGCEEQVLQTLQDLVRLRLDGTPEKNEILFDAQQNARIVAGAETYYRAMIRGEESSWNIRDRHMMNTLEILCQRFGTDTKCIVWAHNTHIGDYRATDMESEGLINIGGLARQRWGPDRVSLIGFGTYEGEVIASHQWGGPIEKMKIPPARAGSYEALFHDVARSLKKNAFFLTQLKDASLSLIRGHRAIGVVYNPQHEQRGNYVPTSIAHRYDAFIYVDYTTALKPIIQKSDIHDIPETWPSGE